MIIDTNVSLSRWPFRRLAGDDPAGLVARLRKRGVGQAWAGTFDGVFHKDIAAANARLAADCRRYGEGFLLPFGSVNPKLPGWQEDLRRCHEVHRMRGIRLHPNYHGYDLKEPVFTELLRLAAARKLIVQLAVRMEDERAQHPLMRVPPVDLAPLPGLLEREPQVRLMLLNSAPGRGLPAAGQVRFEISSVEGVGGVARLIGQTSLQRVLFGSHFPLFYFESALLKVQEAGLTEEQRGAVLSGNAKALLG